MISENIRVARMRIGLNQADLARKLGVGQAVVSNWERGRNAPSRENMTLLAEALGVTVDWLLHKPDYMNRDDLIELELLPLLEVEVAAGDGSIVESEHVESMLTFRTDWLRKEGLHSKDLVMVRARGNSMSPTLQDGDVLLVDRAQTTPRSENVYVLRIGSEVFVKRLRLENGTISVISDNPTFPVRVLPAENVHVAGRVVWFGRKLI